MKVLLLVFAFLALAWGRDPRCPIENETDTVRLIPHDTDCDKYYTCHPEGLLIEMWCLDGLEFDPELSICNWPRGACVSQVIKKNV